MLLEARLVPVCASCEQEFGYKMRLEPGDQPSHGLCKRHALEMVQQTPKLQQLYRRYSVVPEDQFPADLAKHPELLDRQQRKQDMFVSPAKAQFTPRFTVH